MCLLVCFRHLARFARTLLAFLQFLVNATCFFCRDTRDSTKRHKTDTEVDRICCSKTQTIYFTASILNHLVNCNSSSRSALMARCAHNTDANSLMVTRTLCMLRSTWNCCNSHARRDATCSIRNGCNLQTITFVSELSCQHIDLAHGIQPVSGLELISYLSHPKICSLYPADQLKLIQSHVLVQPVS